MYTANMYLNLLPLLVFVIAGTLKRTQKTFIDALLQASFYIYVFYVLFLTIFFIPFVDIAYGIINSQLLEDISIKISFYLEYGRGAVGINLIPFQKFADYNLLHRQVVGNLIMLFPLGLYLPLLYKYVNTLKKVMVISFAATFSIELTQLIVTLLTPFSSGQHYFRTFDIDDILLNFMGALIGYQVYKATILIRKKLMSALSGVVRNKTN